MSFAALQDRVNRTSLQRLGSGGIVLNGVPVTGDYVAPHFATDYAAATKPQAMVLSSDVPPNVVGMSLMASSLSFTVAEAEPDGYGFHLLLLEAA